MKESLFTVEDAYAHGDGLVLAPFLPSQPNRKVRVRYESPDGSGGIVNGHVESAVGKVWAPGRITPTHQSALVVDVPGFSAPAGTRIWVVEDVQSGAPPTVA